MVVLDIAGILVAAYIIARVMREQDTEGEPWPDSPGVAAGTSAPGPDAGSAASSSPSVHLFDQEADRVYAALMERVEEVAHP